MFLAWGKLSKWLKGFETLFFTMQVIMQNLATLLDFLVGELSGQQPCVTMMPLSCMYSQLLLTLARVTNDGDIPYMISNPEIKHQNRHHHSVSGRHHSLWSGILPPSSWQLWDLLR